MFERKNVMKKMLPYMKYIIGALVLVLAIVGGIFLFKGDKKPEDENIGLEEVELNETEEDYFDLEEDSEEDKNQESNKDDNKDDKENTDDKDETDDKDNKDNVINDGSEGRIF